MRRYYPLKDFLNEKFGCRVSKVSLNAGFTCPNRDGTKGTGGCSYCNSSTLIAPTYANGMGIKEQLERGIKYIRKRKKADKFIAYFQTYSNTYAPIHILERLYMDAIEHPDVVALAISTRPDCLDEKILDLLQRISRTKHLWLELGLQSSNNSTLESIKRGHTAADFVSAFELASQRGIPVCAHVILGLPGETRDDMLKTARLLAELNIWGVKLHPLHIHKGTELEDMYMRGEIRPLELEEYANLVIDFLEELLRETVVHRICGSTPKRFLVAPEWGADRFNPPALIRKLMEERDTYQGAKLGLHG